MEPELLSMNIAGCLAPLGIVLAGVGIMRWQNIRYFVQTAEHAEGTVIELIKGDRTRNGTTYRPVVEFIDSLGQRHEHQSSVGSNPSLYSVGDKVQILYNQNDIDSVKINHWHNLYFFRFFISSKQPFVLLQQ